MNSPKPSSSWNVPHSLCILSFPSRFLTHFLLLLKFSLFDQTKERFRKIMASYFYHFPLPFHTVRSLCNSSTFPLAVHLFYIHSTELLYFNSTHQSNLNGLTREPRPFFLRVPHVTSLYFSEYPCCLMFPLTLYIAFFMSPQNQPSPTLFAYTNQNSVQRSYLSA
jgi:hypothetical protein